jgi:cytochrome bd-type quinol oxidase subunit 2
MRLAMTIAVLLINIWALLAVLGSRASRARRFGWVMAITLLPVAGAVGWHAVDRRDRRPIA